MANDKKFVIKGVAIPGRVRNGRKFSFRIDCDRELNQDAEVELACVVVTPSQPKRPQDCLDLGAGKVKLPKGCQYLDGGKIQALATGKGQKVRILATYKSHTVRSGEMEIV